MPRCRCQNAVPWDDAPMTDDTHLPEQPSENVDDLQADLEAADAADAPEIAEKLASALAAELDADEEGRSR